MYESEAGGLCGRRCRRGWRRGRGGGGVEWGEGGRGGGCRSRVGRGEDGRGCEYDDDGGGGGVEAEVEWVMSGEVDACGRSCHGERSCCGLCEWWRCREKRGLTGLPFGVMG